MSDSARPTQVAFIAKYRADTALQGLMQAYNPAIVGPEWNIFDQGGSGQSTAVFPYVYVHPITMKLGTLLTMGTDANDVYMQVDVWTDEEGFDQADVLMARLYSLTHGPIAGPFTLGGSLANVLTLFDNRQKLEKTTDQQVQQISDRYKLYNQG